VGKRSIASTFGIRFVRFTDVSSLSEFDCINSSTNILVKPWLCFSHPVNNSTPYAFNVSLNKHHRPKPPSSWIAGVRHNSRNITSQRGSAWHCYIGRLISKGKMRFSTSRPGKTNEYFGTKLFRRDDVGKIYKLTKFGADRLPNGASTWWWNITVLRLSSPGFFLFFRFLGQPKGRNFRPNCTLNSSKVVLRLIHVPFKGLVPSNSLWRGLQSTKPPNFDP